jgi:hypothetical protein
MNTQKPNDEVPVGYYIVAYLDVLGQKDHLKKMDELPKSPQEREELIQNLKRTYGKIDLFRKAFEMFFQSFIKARQASPLSPSIHRIFSIPQVKKHFFSDTVVLYSSLAEHESNFALNNIFAIIDSISKLYLFMLSDKFVFRGGVDVGIGCEFLDGEIYGNALYKAYELESKAKYPRVIVGDNLIKCVKGYRGKSTDPLQAFASAIAEACLNCIQKDCNDGNYILLPAYSNGMKNEMECWKKSAITFAKDEVSRFTEENNIELKNRYEALEKVLMTMNF